MYSDLRGALESPLSENVSAAGGEICVDVVISEVFFFLILPPACVYPVLGLAVILLQDDP